MLQVAVRRGLLIEPLNRHQLRARVLDLLGAPLVFLVSISIAYLTDGNTAILCWLTLLIVRQLRARLIRLDAARVGTVFDHEARTFASTHLS